MQLRSREIDRRTTELRPSGNTCQGSKPGRGALGLLSAALVLAILAAGCGGTQRAPDLFEVKRTGKIPGANLTLLVTDNGTVRCNGGAPKPMPGDLLVQSRGLTEDLAADIAKPRPEIAPLNSIYTFRIRLGAGSATWMDGTPGLPQSLLELARLTRQIAKGVCGLKR